MDLRGSNRHPISLLLGGSSCSHHCGREDQAVCQKVSTVQLAEAEPGKEQEEEQVEEMQTLTLGITIKLAAEKKPSKYIYKLLSDLQTTHKL